jgi:ABC-type transport system substrate-binding protein
LRDFTDLGIYLYDIYNQKWPTGVGDMPGDVLTYDPDSMTEKAYFGDNQPWDNMAWQFRLAIRYLTDIDYIQTDILGGYGNMFDTQLAPLQEGWLDMANLTTSSFTAPYGGITIPSLIYPHTQDIGMAEDLLDAAGFVKPGGASDLIRNDPRNPGNDLEPLIFYIRLDDPMRKAAGEKLAADLQSIGVPVDVRVVEKTVCFKSVMVEYNYHLYTGGYSIGFDPLLPYGIWHSSQYWGPTIGWSGGYQGFCNREYDPAAYDCMFGSDRPSVLNGVKVATYVHNKYVPTVPLYAYAGVHGYATGWDGLVNRAGYGMAGDNPYTFWQMHKTGENTIKWGFKANAEAFHVVCSEWVWDYWAVVDNTYDGILMRNPYNPAKKWGVIGLYEPGPDGLFETLDDIRGWSTGMWDGGTKIYCNISIREDAYFHDGTQVTPEDCKFSIDFLQACGPGVAWGYSGVIDVDHVDTYDYTGAGGRWGIVVYFTSGTYWAENFAGFQYVLNKKVWVAAGVHEGWGYDPVANTFTPIENRFMVREYHPWEHDYYDAATGLSGSDGIDDIKQDGSGPWIYLGADPLLMEYYDLEANRDWHLTQTFVSDFIAAAFHDIGDVDRSSEISVNDQDLVGRAFWTTSATGGIPGQWGAWNPDADLNLDDVVNIYDAYIAGRGYGKLAG